jgi:hypothetical protein
MWCLWILNKAIMMLCLLFYAFSSPTTKAYVELIRVEIASKSILAIYIL